MNKQLLILTLLLTALLLTTNIPAQENNTVLAKIGNQYISTAEYRNRFELMPHLNPGEANSDSIKLNFLYTLIAEKLWAMQAKEIGLGNTDYIKFSLNSLKKLFVRDALFNLEVKNKFTVSEEDLNDGIQKSSIALDVNVISAYDSSKVFQLFNSISLPEIFDSLFVKHDSTYQTNNVKIYFGDLKDEDIEDQLYNLDINEISTPFHYEDGWFIFKLVEKIPQSFNEQQQLELTANVKKIINERRSMNKGNSYLQKLLSGVKINADYTLGKSLSEKIISRISENAKFLSANDSSKIYLSETDIYQIMDEFGADTLAMDFLLFDKNPVSLKEFLFDLIQTGFSVRSSDRNQILRVLSLTVKFMIRQELITREGYRLGLHNLPEVNEDMKTWEDTYLSQALRNRFLDSIEVNDDEVYQFYMSRNGEQSNLQLKIVEILCADLRTIETALTELQNGKSFEELAAKFTERELTKNTNGEFDWFYSNQYGEIGKNAATMEVGEIFGPIFTPDGYSLFKLIGKKKTEKLPDETFEQLKNQLKIDAKANKLSDKFDSYTSSLAKKYGVNIYTSALNNLVTTQLNMFTYRYIGFGGVISAFPYLSPWYNWAKKSENNVELLP